MDINFNLFSTFNDAVEQTEILRGYVEDDSVRLRGDLTVAKIQHALEFYTAYSRREYNTRVPTVEERNDYIITSGALSYFLGILVTNDLRNRYSELNGDTGVIREEASNMFRESNSNVSQIGYEIGLNDSRVERVMHDLSGNDIINYLAPRLFASTVTAMTSIAIIETLNASGEYVDISPARGGLVGATAPIMAYGAYAAARGTARYVGGLAKSSSQSSIGKYRPDESHESEEEIVAHINALIRRLAIQNTKELSEGTSADLLDYKMRGKDDIQPMMERVSRQHHKRVLARDGITLGRDETNAPWYRSLPSKITGIDFLG